MKRFASIFLAGVLVGYICSPTYPMRCSSVRANGAIAVVCR